MTGHATTRVVGDWQLEHEIGSGSFAVVWRARRVSTGELGAVKEINTDKLNKKLYESLASEVAVLNQTQHDNIVRLLDVFKDGNRIYIVLEFCTGGDLGNYIRRYGRVSESTARYFLQQLAEGLKELRKHNVVHRDLKPQNLLLSNTTAQPLLKIADFGFARSLAPQGLAETLCGSPLYMAPEILQFQKYDAKADLWSIGTILFELLVGKPPFNGANHLQLLRNIERGEAVLPEATAGRLSGACRGLLAGLLKRNPVERITFEEFFQHPFLLAERTGAVPGVPPPQPPQPAAAPAGMPDLPFPMRRAAAAAAAAAGGGQGPRPGPRPNLHVPAPRPRQPPQQPPQQHQQPPGAGGTMGGGGWVPAAQQPALYHPLQEGPPPPAAAGGGGAPPKPGSALNMSDSIEQDYVVVSNPFKPEVPALGHVAEHGSGGQGSGSTQGSLMHSAAVSTEQRSSAASTGSRADSSALMSAAVAALESPQVVRGESSGRPASSAGQGGQHYQGPLGQHIGSGGHQHTAHQQHHQQQPGHPPGHPQEAAGGPGGAGGPPLPAAVRGTHSGLLALQEQVNRAALLAQLLRAICEVLQQQGGLGDGVLPPEQAAEHVALRLYGLQLLEALCRPQPQPHPQQQKQQQQQEEGGKDPSKQQHAALDQASSTAGQGGSTQQPQAAAVTPQGGKDIVVSPAAASGAQQLVSAADPEDLQLLLEAGMQLLTLLAATAQQTAGGPLAASWMAGQQQQQQAGAGAGPSAAGCASPAAGAAAAGGGGGGAPQVEPLGVVITDAALGLPLPHPVQVLYQVALGASRAAAVEELMGNWESCVSSYSLAADLLLFLVLPWPELGQGLAPGLGLGERRRVQQLYVAVNGRLMLCVQEQEAAAGGGG